MNYQKGGLLRHLSAVRAGCEKGTRYALIRCQAFHSPHS